MSKYLLEGSLSDVLLQFVLFSALSKNYPDIIFTLLFMYRALSKKWKNTADTSGRLFMIDGVLVDSLYNTPEAKKILLLEEQLR